MTLMPPIVRLVRTPQSSLRLLDLIPGRAWSSAPPLLDTNPSQEVSQLPVLQQEGVRVALSGHTCLWSHDIESCARQVRAI